MVEYPIQFKMDLIMAKTKIEYIIEYIIEKISNKTLIVGSRLPSVRQFQNK